ncbi:MAG: right-handed parallel beta-helix repeat-containing protein [Ignavibacteriae bacterium]|nr:right-handed parallel beta-helix repeat-containing protein [Ignavibacteriota bacterium]
MTIIARTFLLTSLSSILLMVEPSGVMASEKIEIRTAAELHELFSKRLESKDVYLLAGTFHLSPTNFTDSTCGNCQELNTLVQATYGIRVRGRNIRIAGPDGKAAVIVTHAGYGIFFDGCADCSIENVTITGGARDTSGSAADAAIVVKKSSLVISNNIIRDNIGDSATVAKTVVGIMGICCRENSDVTITNNEIIRNSWDGIALYREAVAKIENNVIDGVDKARGTQVGGGRGVAIGVTWNGKATIRNNLVTRYWKGIGLFVDAQGTVEGNIVEDILTWGISYWDADKGRPVGFIRNNIIYKTGACGASITRSHEGERTGEFTGNIIVETGQNPKYDSPDYYCYQCALALHAVPKSFVIDDNLFHNNRRATPDLPDNDVSLEQFLRVSQAKRKSLATIPQFGKSIFLKDFGS